MKQGRAFQKASSQVLRNSCTSLVTRRWTLSRQSAAVVQIPGEGDNKEKRGRNYKERITKESWS